jgi:CheY-like chemotaxis protein
MPDPFVLVVEDDDDLRETTASILAAEGFRTLCAAHGLEALAMLKNGAHIGAVVMDVRMPVMDGGTLRRALLDDPALCDLPVVVVTAHAESAKGIPSDLVLYKPYPAEALVAAVEACVPRSRARAEDDAAPIAPPRK